MILFLTVLLFACQKRAEVSDACDIDPGYCLPCTSDDECLFEGNDCTASVVCAQKDAQLAFIEIGCTVGTDYAWPPEEDCSCQSGECRYTGSWISENLPASP